MRKHAALCFAFMLAAFAAASPVEETYLLRLKLQPEQTVKYQVKTETNMQAMGQDLGQSSSMVVSMATKTGEKGIAVTTTISDVKLEFAEGNPMAGQADESKSALESMKITGLYDELGAPLEVKVDSSNPMVAMMAGSIAGGRTGFMGTTYPKQALKIGDTWQVDLDLAKMLNPTADKTSDKKSLIPIVYKLEKVENGIATVTTVTKGKGDAELPQGMAMTLNLDMKSTMHIELATGLLQDATTEGTTEAETGMGTMTQKTKATVKRV